ncbi:MAG TPA: LuxR C-terminal-related transcriptional regulator [Acidimicrobiales bacterium]|nr:LuxR C-terminal-related transcriptional regulator [Acidimicrobiales bacterium]
MLRAGKGAKLTLISAPAGWGKSSLLAAWAAVEGKDRSFAWFAVDEADNDPLRFWTYVIEALRTVEPSIGASSLAVLRAPGTGLTDLVIPELIDEIEALDGRVVLAIDDYHLITQPEIHASVAFLITHLPSLLHVAIATRAEPGLPIATLRARGELVEVGAGALGFSDEEADRFLNELLDLGLTRAEVNSLWERTEGWAAGLYLAALSLRDRRDRQEFIAQFAGDHRHIVDYLGAEVLASLDDQLRTFLLRTSILARLTGPLCDAVAGTGGSAGRLGEVERSNLFLVPLDARREWYRYHHLFGDLLRRELKAREPALVAELHHRAARWLLEAGHVSEAILHTIAAGDLDRACELIATHWIGFLAVGDHGPIASWLQALPEDALTRDARVCVAGAFLSLSSGRLEDTELWLERAQRADVAGPFMDGCGSVAGAISYVRMGHRVGIGALHEARALAREAVEFLEETSPHRQMAFAILGLASYLLGHVQESLSEFQDGLRQGRIVSVEIGDIVTLGLLAGVRADLGQWDEAESLAARAIAISARMGGEEYWGVGLSHLVRGRALERRGQLEDAEAALSRGTQLLRRGLPVFLAYALPGYACFKNARGHREEARTLIREARSLVDALPDPGILPDLVEKAERRLRLAPCRQTAPLVEELSSREFSVLRLLTSTLSQRQIAGELHVSMNTVKSHTKSIFRKLGVSTRTEAVIKGREHGLI